MRYVKYTQVLIFLYTHFDKNASFILSHFSSSAIPADVLSLLNGAFWRSTKLSESHSIENSNRMNCLDSRCCTPKYEVAFI